MMPVTLFTDLRYALRLMRRSPGFTAVAVLSLALGIGANTAIFSLVYTVMLRTLPVEHPEQLVEIMQKYPGEARGLGYWNWAQYSHFRDNSRCYSALTGTSFDNRSNLHPDHGESEPLVLEFVAGNYFPTLGLTPAMGRLLGPDDVPAAGEPAAVVVSWSYWNTRLDRDPAVLGKRLWIEDQPKTIVGVAPRAYAGPRVGSRTDVWMPRRKNDAIELLGRLKPGIPIEQARAEAAVLFRPILEEKIARSHNPLVRGYTVEVDSAAAGFTRVRDMYGKPLVLLMFVVGLLLLLACINMASMLLARGAARQREIAVRVGLGASRGRLVRQMLTESILLSGAGAIVGVGFAYGATAALVRIMASGRLHERVTLHVDPDLRLLLFTIAIAILTGVLFGLAPAWYAFRIAPASPLRATGRGGDTRFWRAFGKSLVAAQVALSILLVTAAAVFLGHVARLRTLDLGFRSDHVLLVQLDPERSGYDRFHLLHPYQELIARLEAIPGVRSVSLTGCTPIQGCGASQFVTAEGFVERPEARRYTALNWVSPRYFETLGIPLLAGRDFTAADAGRSRVAIINQSLARYYFPGANPVGKHLVIDRFGQTNAWYGDESPYEIIGVAGDTKYTELRDPAPRTMFMLGYQEARLGNQFALRTSIAPEAVAQEARRAVREVLQNVPDTNVTTLATQVDAAIVPERLIAMLSELFGALGAALASIGLYGLLAYTVSRRINEIGVRMALGATAGHVRRLVLGDALAMVAAGLFAGAALVVWMRPLAAKLLPDLEPAAAAPVAGAATAVLAIGLLAAYIPARRAARVDPMDALRHE